jgi:tRNA pseudouridine13 synthase
MYKIKEKCEDFIVSEIISITPSENGSHALCLLTKKDTNTLKAAQLIANKLGIKEKDVGFAGTKDKKAVTKQHISIKGAGRKEIEDLRFDNITLLYLGRIAYPINLGMLEGNKFEIIVRNIDNLPERKETFPNYFGEQRFSENNADIGKALIKKNFAEACRLILLSYGEHENDAREHLETSAKDYVGAIKKIPRKIIMIYVHAYQSLIWNKTLERYIEKNKDDAMIPLVGFGTDLDSGEVSNIIKEILKEEGITERDFIIRSLPEATFEGSIRPAFCRAENLDIGELEDDENNPGMKKTNIRFSLPKGSYATSYLKHLFS